MAIYSEFYKGQNKSKYEQSGFDKTANLDVHSEIGTAKCQLALASESTTPNENCISAVVPTGDVYFFSTSSGKIWKRQASDNSYSLAHTNANTSHKGAKYFNGNLYFVASKNTQYEYTVDINDSSLKAGTVIAVMFTRTSTTAANRMEVIDGFAEIEIN